MFKSRRMGTRKCRDYRQMFERSGDKSCKIEGNSNIMSNRVTIPPGYLCHGFRSKAERRSPYDQNFGPDKNYVVDVDHHELFNDNLSEKYKKPRRSSRISKKSESTQTDDSLLASNSHSKGLETENLDFEEERRQKRYPGKGKTIVRNNSKSIFKKINERCAKARTKKSALFNYPIVAVVSSKNKVEHLNPVNFCLNLSRELRIDLNQNDYLSRCKLSINKKINEINDKLHGNMSSKSPSPKKNKTDQVSELMKQDDFHYVPKCDWVFETPPRQRVVLPKVDECPIQPAVICTTEQQSNIFELKPNLNVDFTGFSNRQNVPVDGRYMRQLATFQDKTEKGAGLGITFLGGSNQTDQPDGRRLSYGKRKCKEYSYSDAPSVSSDYFSEVISRPTKTVKKISRTDKLYTYKREKDPTDTPTGINLFQSVENYEQDYTFVEDEGGFKIVNIHRAVDETSSTFNFRKNLFNNVEENMFNFSLEKPTVFDFTQLKN